MILDVTDAEQIAALNHSLPERLDAVVNNAGIVVVGPLETLRPDDFRRQLDVNVIGQLAVTQAVLGDEIEVPTLEGPHELSIPEGTQTGAELRIKGKGVPEVQGRGRGDLVVHLDVKIPAKLTREQRKLFEQLAESLPVNNAPQEKGLFEKVKDYFM